MKCSEMKAVYVKSKTKDGAKNLDYFLNAVLAQIRLVATLGLKEWKLDSHDNFYDAIFTVEDELLKLGYTIEIEFDTEKEITICTMKGWA